VEVSAPNYVTASHPVTIAAKDQAEVVDTALTTGIATVTRGELDWLLGQGQTATADVTVTNTGSAPLQVELSEQRRTDDGGHEAADLPWLTLMGGAADGTVELGVGESTTVTAKVDNAGVEPGILVGDVLVASNAGKDASQLQPVQLATSAYWQGVDAGGAGFVGADGFVWSPDRALGSEPWGYIGGTERATKADIGGTEDDDLFRTQRTGKTFSYVFKDVPAGTYRIGLDFAEIDKVKAGMRAFDVLVNGIPVLHDHDVQATAGALTADAQEVAVEHAGGDLTIEFRGEISEREPILNGVRVREDPRL
jgi:hypothetical protein